MSPSDDQPQAQPHALVYTVSVVESSAGERLDVFLARALPLVAGEEAAITRSHVQRLLREGAVSEASVPAGRRPRPPLRAADKVRVGQEFDVRLPAPPPSQAAPEAIPLDVVFEDQYLIAVNKPRGMVVHPAAGHSSGTLVNALLAWCPELAGDGDPIRPGIVHRLDRDTTGLIVAAKDPATRLGLERLIKGRDFDKTYLALVHGNLPTPTGRIDANIGRSQRHRKKMAVLAEGGRTALTLWRTLASFGNFSLLEVALHTGRTHQIRVHLAHLGHPVVGDIVYGRGGGGGAHGAVAAAIAHLEGQALHAWRLGFVHPATGVRLDLEAPPSNDFAAALNGLYRTVGLTMPDYLEHQWSYPVRDGRSSPLSTVANPKPSA